MIDSESHHPRFFTSVGAAGDVESGFTAVIHQGETDVGLIIIGVEIVEDIGISGTYVGKEAELEEFQEP